MDVSRRALVGPALIALTMGCGGGSSPTTPPVTPPSPVAPAPSPSPSPSPSAEVGIPAGTSCRYGVGSPTASCARHSAQLSDAVSSAIDELVRTKPDLFDLNDQFSEGAYRVRNVDKYYAGVVEILQQRDFCAAVLFDDLLVKNSSEFSEAYDILLGSGHIWKGSGSYQETCQPASFPVAAEDVIAGVRVAFFGIRCNPGITPPRNGEGLLPVGCSGDVTATPKKADGTDVPESIHGDKIEWQLLQDAPRVVMHDYPNVKFNKILVAQEYGPFALCATVKGHTGCLYGDVPTPKP
ncbi:MAG TPA: hypothetical protein VFM29_00040 [Vicinamibacteria bacterium]|nr:hypothetical protein [Vicinamibacteria bacterium]